MAVKKRKFFYSHGFFRGQEKMRRMSKPSKNNTFVLFLVSPTAYKGTPRARFAYSIKLVLCGLHFFYNPLIYTVVLLKLKKEYRGKT